MRHQAVLTIPIAVARDAGQPLHEQIASQVCSAVELGLLTRDAQLPSTRTLAGLLGVSRGVANAAYDLLSTRGYLASQPGSGSYVSGSHDTAAGAVAGLGRVVEPVEPVDLRPGQASAEALPLPAWRAAWRDASFRRPPVQALPALGMPELRRAVAEHVTRTRGIALRDREVVVTGGTAHGLRLVLDALGRTGSEVTFSDVAVEQPSALLAALPGRPVPVPVDRAGARIGRVPAHCRVLVLTPEANVPLGHALSAARRAAAADWAGRHDRRLIEVAGDAVFRSGPPRLATLSAGTVVLDGFCELLTPALKLGYAIVPRELAAAVGARIGDRGEQPPHVTQLAVAALLRDGTVTRLMYRLERLAVAKRAIVRETLGGLDGLRLSTRDSQATAVLELPGDADEAAVAGDLLAHGVRIDRLSTYQPEGSPPALVLGFGHLPDPVLRRGLSILRDGLSAG